jgi:probable rRNA maturation factor
LKRVAATAARLEGFRTGELSLAIVTAPEMARLHRRFADVGGATDVLTFDYGSDRRQGVLQGEVIACADVALQRVGGAALALARRELALYVTHGVLHLAGYDDREPAAYRRMHAREDSILLRLGLGPVFSCGPRRRGG